MSDNSSKIILDLCGGTGSWSKPYKDAGYDVRLITLPEYDVRDYHAPANVYGILAAPPCTDFSVACNNLWMFKDIDGRTIESMGIVMSCLKIIARAKPQFWALENPAGRLKRWLGAPALRFNPCDYGDPWTKKTCLWGEFNMPEKHPVQVNYRHPEGSPSKIHFLKERPTLRQAGVTLENLDRATLRAITPPGFARAFYEANK